MKPFGVTCDELIPLCPDWFLISILRLTGNRLSTSCRSVHIRVNTSPTRTHTHKNCDKKLPDSTKVVTLEAS